MHVFAAVVLSRGELGESDCEEIGDGILGQPVNAISSGAYTLLGLWLVWRAIRSDGDEKPVAILYGLALASVGVGSIAFHGPVPPGARLLHDLTIAAVVTIIAARNLGSLLRWPTRTILGVTGLMVAVIGAVMAYTPDLGNILTGVIGVAAIATEVILYRSGRRRFSRRVGQMLLVIALLLATAGVINVLGRTGGPICDPDSLFQGHALWHFLTAGAFMLYGYTAFRSDSP